MNQITITENKDVEVDIIDTLKKQFCISIASNKKTKNRIDEIFNTNKAGYLKAYQDSSFYKEKLIDSCSEDIDTYVKKVIGIVEKGLKDENYVDIFNLYKKAFMRRYIKTVLTKKVYITKDIAKYLIRRYKDDEGALCSIFMFYLLDNGVNLPYKKSFYINY